MSEGFDRTQVDSLLALCHRRCCICHRFCGVKMETEHIVPQPRGGDDSIANAIPVCFECYAEIRTYDPDQPRGRRFTPDELRQHKAQWIEICQSKPEALLSARRRADVGPIQALVDELEFNLVVCRQATDNLPPCRFRDEQLRRAVAEGAISVLVEDLRTSILQAYVTIGRVNQVIDSLLATPRGTTPADSRAAHELCQAATHHIEAARQRLLGFL